jgi:hypothetical protein
MIASKVLCDETYSNESWGIVAQEMFVLKELNQMEREMCGYLEWNLNVLSEEVIEFEASLRAEYSTEAPVEAPRPAWRANHLGVPMVTPCSTPRDQAGPLSAVPAYAVPLHGLVDPRTATAPSGIFIAHPGRLPPATVLHIGQLVSCLVTSVARLQDTIALCSQHRNAACVRGGLLSSTRLTSRHSYCCGVQANSQRNTFPALLEDQEAMMLWQIDQFTPRNFGA